MNEFAQTKMYLERHTRRYARHLFTLSTFLLVCICDSFLLCFTCNLLLLLLCFLFVLLGLILGVLGLLVLSKLLVLLGLGLLLPLSFRLGTGILQTGNQRNRPMVADVQNIKKWTSPYKALEWFCCFKGWGPQKLVRMSWSGLQIHRMLQKAEQQHTRQWTRDVFTQVHVHACVC